MKTILISTLLAMATVSYADVFESDTPSNAQPMSKTEQALSVLTAQQLAERLAPINSLISDYQQTTFEAAGRTVIQSGQITLVKPNKFEMMVFKPYPQTVTSNGEFQWIYEPDLEQVTRSTLTEINQQSPAYLLTANKQQISELYFVAPVASNEYKLVPKSDDSLIEVIYVTFENELPVMISVDDVLGNQTQIRFENMNLNVDINDSYFDFDIPLGSDVIYQ